MIKELYLAYARFIDQVVDQDTIEAVFVVGVLLILANCILSQVGRKDDF